jgi:hypothetical protein
VTASSLRLLIFLLLTVLALPGCTTRRGGGSGGGDDDDSADDDDDNGDDDDLFNPDDDDAGPDDDDAGPDDDDAGPDDDDAGPDDDDAGHDDDDAGPDDDDVGPDDDDIGPDDDDTAVPGECTPFAWLSCSAPDDSNTTNSGSATDSIDNYSCPASGLTGPEMAYWFSAPDTGTYTVNLTGLSSDLDLLVLEGYSCDSNADCPDYSGGSGSEQIVWTASAGDDFVIVVDGDNNASGNYDIEITCPVTGDDDDSTASDDDDSFGDDDDSFGDDDDFTPPVGGCTDNETETNDTQGTADGPLTSPTDSWCGSISGAGDSDWYEMTVTSSLTSLIMTTDFPASLSCSGTNVDTELFYYDSTGTLLDSDDDGGDNTLCSLIVANNVSPGTYYVKVEHYSNSGSGDYQLDVAFN